MIESCSSKKIRNRLIFVLRFYQIFLFAIYVTGDYLIGEKS